MKNALWYYISNWIKQEWLVDRKYFNKRRICYEQYYYQIKHVFSIRKFIDAYWRKLYVCIYINLNSNKRKSDLWRKIDQLLCAYNVLLWYYPIHTISIVNIFYITKILCNWFISCETTNVINCGLWKTLFKIIYE